MRSGLPGGGCRCLGTRILQALNELLQTRFQSCFRGFGQVNEAKRLEPALGSPHGEHHLCFLADGGFTKVEDHFHLEFFVEWLFQMHEAAGGGELMQFASYLAPVGQSHEGQDRTAQLDSKGSVPAAGKPD
jgi:hypothetical protein